MDHEYNNYTKYKRGFPRVRTRSWTKPSQTVTIFPATIFNLDPLEDHIIRKCVVRSIHTSKEIARLNPEEIAALPLPRLAPLLKGLAQKYLDTFDDMAMIAVEQLVDGMTLDRD